MWNIAGISLVLVIRRNRLRVEAFPAHAESRPAAREMAVGKLLGAANLVPPDGRVAVSPSVPPSPDIMAVPCVLRALDPSARRHDVVVLARDRQHLRLQSLMPIAPGTAAQLKLEGESLLGEITASIARNGHFEIWVQLREVLRDSWQPHPDWNIQDSEESMAGSLAALNARLMFHELQRTNPECEPQKVGKAS